MKIFMKLCCLTLILGFTSCDQDSDFQDSEVTTIDKSFSAKNGNGASKTTSRVYNPSDPSVTLGESTLIRNNNGVSTVYKTWDLIPGHAYSLWILVINEPENCVGSPCLLSEVFPGSETIIEPELLYIDGLVAGDDGNGTFSGRLNENDDSTSINHIVALPLGIGGLWDARTAEIHLVLRSHGPAIPGQTLAQTTTFLGGCIPGLGTGMFQGIPMVEGSCGQIQASIHIAN